VTVAQSLFDGDIVSTKAPRVGAGLVLETGNLVRQRPRCPHGDARGEMNQMESRLQIGVLHGRVMMHNAKG
jgi:hypothetical protein